MSWYEVGDALAVPSSVLHEARVRKTVVQKLAVPVDEGPCEIQR